MGDFIPKEVYTAKHEALEKRVDKNEDDIADFCDKMDEHIGKIYDKVNAISTDTAIISTKVNSIVADFCIKVDSNSRSIVTISERLQIQKETNEQKLSKWQFNASIIFFIVAAVFNIIINMDKIIAIFK